MYNGGFVYINVPSLAAWYVMAKDRYKKRILLAQMDRCEKEDEFWKDDYFANMRIAEFARDHCLEILSAIKNAGKMEEFKKAVAFVEYCQQHGISTKTFVNSIYGRNMVQPEGDSHEG